MKNPKILFLLFTFYSISIFSQIGINTGSPQNSALLHIIGPEKPVMLPKISNPVLFDGKTQLKAGLYFDDIAGQKCISYIETDGSRSTCLLTVADVSVSNKYESSFTSPINLSATTFTNLLSVSIPSVNAPRQLFASFDILKNVSVAVLGRCAATDFEIRLTNTTTSTTTILYSGQTYIAPRKANSTDVYPFNQINYALLSKNQSYTVNVVYKKSSSCNPSTDQALQGSLTVAVY